MFKLSQMGRSARTLAVSLLAAGLVVGCSSDSPSEPQQNPGGGGGGGGGATTAWNISVTSSRPQLEVNSETAALINISVRRADTGAPPPDGTTATLTTTLGDLNTRGSGVTSGVLQLFGGNASVQLFAGAVNGTASVQVQLENSVGGTNIQFTGTATFFLEAISPNQGDSNGGEVVRITGGGFFEPVRVLFGPVAGEVLETTNTLIRVRTPNIGLEAGQTSTVAVQVTVGLNTDQELSDALPGVFTFTEDPIQGMEVFSVTPNAGPNEGGTQITITGQGFSNPMQVLFGSGSAEAFSGVEAIVRSVTASQVVVESPAATGFGVDNRDAEVAILVRNLNSGEAAVFGNAFQYGNDLFVTAISPSVGPAEGGQLVTVFGQGFDEPVSIGFAGVAASPISVTGSEVIARTGAVEIPANGQCNDVVGVTSITNIETGATATGPNYEYNLSSLIPFVTNVSPTTVSADGGEAITISGGNFTSPLQVLIDGGISTVQSVSGGSIVFTMPVFAGDLDTEACDDNGDGTDGERFIDTVVARPIDVRISGGCALNEVVEVNFVVQPTDRTCRNDEGPPDPPPTPPTASFTAVINGLTVSFDNTSTNATSFSWDFGDGTTSSQRDPQRTYAAAGTYTVRLTASGPGGSDTAFQNVTVNP